VDAYRLVSGMEVDEDHAFDIYSELVGTKLIELFTEGVPGKALTCVFISNRCLLSFFIAVLTLYNTRRPLTGSLLQMYVLLKTSEISNRAIASIVISAMTAGFTSASISFE
jgi:hypothetical protein